MPAWSLRQRLLASNTAAADVAFAAVHPEAGRIDATLLDLGCGMSWAAVHKARPRVALRCPACGHGVHAKVSSRKLRYFAHDPGRPADCVWLNESLEHHRLKLALATAIRTVGWRADLEARAPNGSWRADVLAVSLDGTHQVAWEAQLSPITDEDISERTLRYQNDGVGVCWVSTAARVPWMGVVPSIRVRDTDSDTNGNADDVARDADGDVDHDLAWTVIDGVAGFRYSDGAWRIQRLPLDAFVGWVLYEQTFVHQVRTRYRRIGIGAERRYVRRHLIWTTSRSVDEMIRHDAMRQRQDERKRQQREREQTAEQRRRDEAEARRQEEQRQREIAEAAERARREQQWEEQRRQWALEAAQARRQREAEERRRQEQARAAEQERLQQEQREQQAARQWWQAVSSAQVDELRAAVADPVWKKDGIRLEFDSHGPPASCGYGIAIYRSRQLYGVLRPSPASLHRVPRIVPVFVRNAREAHLLTETGRIEPDRVIHFDLPEYEQLSLI
ncbi:competence protein CoiA [Actinophytocola sp.]|uniref:competence protein CoiA n=1 Tax=Actinophytocola sp. TaxID=1872138 RepID=UPI003D6AEF7D